MERKTAFSKPGRGDVPASVLVIRRDDFVTFWEEASCSTIVRGQQSPKRCCDNGTRSVA